MKMFQGVIILMISIEAGTPVYNYPEPDMSPPDDNVSGYYCEECNCDIDVGEIYYVWDDIYLCEYCMQERMRQAARKRGYDDE